MLTYRVWIEFKMILSRSQSLSLAGNSSFALFLWSARRLLKPQSSESFALKKKAEENQSPSSFPVKDIASRGRNYLDCSSPIVKVEVVTFPYILVIHPSTCGNIKELEWDSEQKKNSCWTQWQHLKTLLKGILSCWEIFWYFKTGSLVIPNQFLIFRIPPLGPLNFQKTTFFSWENPLKWH